MFISLIAKYVLYGRVSAKVKAAIRSAEAEAEKIVNDLRADIARVIQEAKAKL